MATIPTPSSPPKRPRLSLQIKAFASGPSGKTSRSLAAAADVKSPTAFNTLSNVYATAVDRSTPVQEKAPANALSGKPTLRLQTQNTTGGKDARLHTPYLGPYLDTPLSAQPMSPAASKEICFPSAMTMTATPPLSSVPPEESKPRVFTFEHNASAAAGPVPQSSTQSSKRRATMPPNMVKAPYSHPRSLRSILRNSPLPPASAMSPESPRRQSRRLQEKAARRVAYHSPLCETIETKTYTKSHVDLLSGDTTPTTPSTSDDDALDQVMSYTGSETRDGGQTPGPFEEMRRRMATLRAATPTASSPSGSGIRKRGKKKEKKRRWVWTIGQDEDGDECVTPLVERKGDEPVAKKETLAVPVIAVPLPRPRTRMQSARATALQIPKLSGIIAPPSQNRGITPEPITAIHIKPPTPILSQEPGFAPVSLRICPPSLGDDRRFTPEPVTAIAIEPPTPSVESIASLSQESVFEASGDVEMSDASSVFSAEGNYTIDRLEMGARHPRLDTDMDVSTPTTAIRCSFKPQDFAGLQPPGMGFGGTVHQHEAGNAMAVDVPPWR